MRPSQNYFQVIDHEGTGEQMKEKIKKRGGLLEATVGQGWKNAGDSVARTHRGVEIRN